MHTDGTSGNNHVIEGRWKEGRHRRSEAWKSGREENRALKPQGQVVPWPGRAPTENRVEICMYLPPLPPTPGIA